MQKFSARQISLIGLAVSLIIIISQISIPMPYGVPMTLQTLIIPVVGILLGKRDGTIAICIYLILGLIGFPVFAGFSGSILSFIGPTGGFLLSFPIMAYLAGQWSDDNVKVYIGLILGTFINLTIGTLYFSWVTGSTLKVAFIACFAPFIFTAIIKIVLAGFIGMKSKRILYKKIKV
ncbi:biotin transporter BioY [Vagococcus vulneris]|uniref:Biotin transporter n=1 Tax=Vagococcus vulneris TaxID=1977869 RepID=A0A429ZX12_9ENTE|nr:biotin transporter BioY [Vagococcus vulneris]RST98394.1 hypothetical protein CBF37_07730 [Vagococcus vulneris]